jgi:hypothetical protein
MTTATDMFSELGELGDLYKSKQLTSLAPLLPIFELKGLPFSLKDHFMLEPMFELQPPRRRTFKCCRQIGKTQQASGAVLLSASASPHTSFVVITPLFEQVKRISANFIDPLIQDSHMRNFYTGQGCTKSVLVKSFKNRATLYFTYAFLNANRTRGIPGDVLWEDEFQDFDTELLPEVEQMISGNPRLGLILRTGTAKSFSSPIQHAWEESSMAEWGIRCGCGYWNIAGVGYDLLKMIGPKGPICAKCGRGIKPREGQWLHSVEERFHSHCGYHISQVIHPYVFDYEDRWMELLKNQQDYSSGKFHNECLGESYDTEDRLFSLQDIRAACALGGWENALEEAENWRSKHSLCCLGIDWGGGGRESFSSTAFAFLGLRNDSDRIDCLFAGRLNRSLRPEYEARLFAELMKKVQPTFLAHDYTGAGNIREVTLIYAGITQNLIIPFSYCLSSSHDVVTWADAGTGSRSSYMIDKSRSLRTLAAMLRYGKIALPAFSGLDRGGLVDDLLALFEDVQHRQHGSDLILVRKTQNKFDDFAHALNIGCSALWTSAGTYPSVTDFIKPVAESDVVAIDPASINLDTWIVNNKEQMQ